jgi:hypothetical protein
VIDQDSVLVRLLRDQATPAPLAHGGRCPVCGQPLTIGVEHLGVADRGKPHLAFAMAVQVVLAFIGEISRSNCC